MKDTVFDNMLFTIFSEIISSDKYMDRTKLIEQFMTCKKKYRFTGVGFFVEFIHDGNITLIGANEARHGEKLLIINNNIQVGTILFLNSGNILMLEGFTYDQEWPKEILEFEFIMPI